jgi:hypothetical protein
MKNKIFKTIWLLIPAMMVAYSCSDSFLEQAQKGSLGDAQAATKKGADQSLIAAYSALKGNTGGWEGSNTGWVYGSIVGGDAHKGSDAGDQSDINSIAAFTSTATNNFYNVRWRAIYDGINRCNATLKILAKLKDVAADDIKKITAESRFLRGFYHFEAKKMWGNIPYVDEKIDYTAGNYKVANNVDAWPLIEADFQFAYDNLEESGMEAGRANKWAAAAFLAKAKLYHHDFAGAKTLFDEVIAKGVTPAGTKYGLNDKFHDNFEAAFDNSKESVFAYQASINDGSGGNNANFDQILNWPYNNGPGGCCGFFQPSFELANSYITNGSGLPLLDASYNAIELKSDQGISSDDAFTPDNTIPLDPRIDWTIGRRGIPYLDWSTPADPYHSFHPGSSWVRLQSNGGPYSPKKNAYSSEETNSITDGSSWTKGLTSINFIFMRYADVLLMAAECEAEVGSLAKATEYVNLVRARAANPAGFVKISTQNKKSDWDAYKDASVASKKAANYDVKQYPATFADKNTALKAIHFERKLELAMEGHRFFDLVRWGETTSSNPIGNPVNLQEFLTYEGTKLGIYKGVTFVTNKHEYYPIPQNQIDLEQTGGVSALTQNPGY